MRREVRFGLLPLRTGHLAGDVLGPRFHDGAPSCEKVPAKIGKFDRVPMSITQFQKARECGESYWLYIVENVSEIDEGGKPNILRIQNPAGRTESITYRRHVWQDFVEPK